MSSLPTPVPVSSSSSSSSVIPRPRVLYAYSPIHSASSEKKPGKATARLIGSATAGAVELMVFHPVDTIAKRLMSSTEKYIQPGKTMSNLNLVIFRNSAQASLPAKFFSLFPGLGFAAGYKITQRVYKFGGQPVVNDALNKYAGDSFRQQFGDKNGKALMSATAGSLIGIGEIVLLPLDVLKIKAQTNPKAIAGANLFRLIATEGRNLYAGAGWTAARNAPGSFALFGATAAVYGSFFHLQDYKQATFAQTFVASVAGAVASIAVSSPLDTIKTRVQNKDFSNKVSGSTVLKNLLRDEGPTALFKGLTPKILMVGPKLIFSFTLAQYLIARIEEAL